jgi:dTDP-4-amino-4,6-dideoxygalactose transaminase
MTIPYPTRQRSGEPPVSHAEPYAGSSADAARPAIFGGQPLFAKQMPIACPSLPPRNELAQAFQEILSGPCLTNGAAVRRFERAAAHYLDVSECVAVSSCTSGLMLVERCLGLTGRVIVPSFTFFATAHSLLWNNLEPVLVDCDAESWNIDVECAERAISPRVSAILAVHLYGNPAAARELERIARRRNLRLIFDAAHAFGARREGIPVGGCGDAEVFSLSPTKPLVAGEGGLIATRNRALADALRCARNYGDHGDYDCRLLGLNARMTELQAALALSGLDGLDERAQARRRVAAAYEERLGTQPGILTQKVRPEDCSSCKDFSIVIDEFRFGICRDFLQVALEHEGLQVRRYFDPPLHRQRLYRRFYNPDSAPLPVTTRLARGVLSLPIHAEMGEQDAARIALRILAIRDLAARNSAMKDSIACPPESEGGHDLEKPLQRAGSVES